MSDRFNALGVPPQFHPHARHFAAVFRALGMTPAQIDAAIAFGAQFDGAPEDLLPQFDAFCEQAGIAPQLADLGIAWHGQVCEHGIEAMPQPPSPWSSPVADARRLLEIEEEMRKPPGESRYWQDAALRDEYRALLERAEEADAWRAEPSSPNDAARRAEIEEVMRTDRAHYERSGMDREYRAILERALPSDAGTAAAPVDGFSPQD